MQECLGTGQGESVKSSRRHKQGHRTESSSRGRGCQGSADSPNCSWKFRSQLGKFLHRCQSCRVRSMRSSGNEMQVVWRPESKPSGWGQVLQLSTQFHPSTDPQDLEGWLSDRNCDLRNAIQFGNPGLVSQIGCFIGQGAGQVAKVGRSSVVDGQSRSAMMSDLIEKQSRRCCFEFRRSIDIAVD